MTNRVASLAAFAVLGASTALSAAAQPVLTTLHDFCSKKDCRDGSGDMISSPLIRDAQGNYFGMTQKGGKFNNGTVDGGTVFELSFDSAGGTWSYRTIFDFVPPFRFGNAPNGPLIIDVNGNLYGTTTTGGATGFDAGMVFELSPNGHGGWRPKLLHEFCRRQTDCWGGASPLFGGVTYAGAASGAPYDGHSPLYGTANRAGAHGKGTLFMLTPRKPGKRYWKQTVLYDFCADLEGLTCLDGTNPQYPLTVDARGRLFGVAWGGLHNAGIVYQFDTETKTFKVLHNFCTKNPCTDGGIPKSGLIPNAEGELLGTTGGGGANSEGTIFKLVPGAASPTFEVLYDFCPHVDCDDGSTPMGNLTMDAAGNLYGTTAQGGAHKTDPRGVGGGTVFELASDKSYRALYSFCAEGGCTDGAYPQTSVLLDTDGKLLAPTMAGGRNAQGTVFALTP